MGGSAFAERSQQGLPAIAIARLSPSTYDALARSVLDRLRSHFARAAIPRSCSWKTSHGDIDVICATPLAQSSPEALVSLFNAAQIRGTGPTRSLAVPLNPREHGPTLTHSHYQLDIHICPIQHFEWCVFRNGYSVTWAILGSIIRPVGLTVNDTGLHLRLAELEHHDRKASLVSLHNDPKTITQWLGLDWDAWQAGLSSQHQLFDWISRCRFLCASHPREGSEYPDIDPARDKLSSEGTDLHSTDRKNLRRRPEFAAFFECYLPSRQSVFHAPVTREAVLRNALLTFGKSEEYARRHAAAVADNRSRLAGAGLLDALRPLGLKQDKMNLIVRAVRRWVTTADDHDAASLILRSEPEMIEEEQMSLASLLDAHECLDGRKLEWIMQHVEELRALERERVKQQQATRLALRAQTQATESQNSHEQ